MKKLLAAVLAAVLALGTATVAFADNTVVDVSLDYDLYQFSAEDKQVDDTAIGYSAIKGGVTLYIPVTTKVDTDDGIKTKNTVSTGYMKNYKMKLDTTASEGMISNVRWQVAEGSDYRNTMYVAVDVGTNNTNKNLEVSFTLTVTPKDSADATVESFDDATEYEYTLYLAPGKASTTTAQPNTGSGNTSTQPQPNTGSGNSTAQSALSSSDVGDVTKAIADAKKNGVVSPRADINVTNGSGISVKDMQTLVTTAKNAGGTVRILADSTEDGKFVGRLYIAPASTASVTTDIAYGVTVSGAESTKAMFEKYYNNNVAAVRLTQNGTFGFPVEVAAKADLSNLNTKNLMFYSYDRATGKYYSAGNQYWIDDAGFLHFTTTLAGDIVITDKALSAK